MPVELTSETILSKERCAQLFAVLVDAAKSFGVRDVEAIFGAQAGRVIETESTGTIKGTITRRIWEGRDGAVHAVFLDGKTFRNGDFVLRIAPSQERNRGIGKFRIWIRRNIWRRIYG